VRARPRAGTARDAAIALAVAVGGVLLSRAIPEFRAQEWTQWVVYGLLALSFAFIWGQAGIFSFGQAAFFGVGGYTYGVVGINLIASTGETVSAMLAGVAVAALLAAAVGYFLFYGEVGEVELAIITLATSLVLLTVMSSTAGPEYRIGEAMLGGYNGMVGVPPLSLGFSDGFPLLVPTADLLALFIALSALTVLGLRILLRRPFGRIVLALRDNELRTQLLGYDTRRYKLAVFVIGGAVAGLAGAGYAAWGTFINPTVFALSQAALVAIWVLVGGRRSLLGAFVGVVVIQQLTSTLGGTGGTATPIVLGAVLVAVVLLLPGGIVPALHAGVLRAVPRLQPRPAPLPPASLAAGAELPSAARPGRPRPGALAGEDLGKSFGGVTALDGVTVRFGDRGVHSLIGPNGAGKSTFFNLLVGRYRPSRGRVRLGEQDITRRRMDQRAQRGIGIKLQVASIYAELPALENLWLAAYARLRDVRRADEQAVAVLEWLGLRDRAHTRAGELSHGAQQWLEIGMVVAAEPDVILLDEPTAGMTREETERTVELVRALGEHAAVIVVEHDMEFVRQLDAPVMMFHEGKVFAEGSIEDLRGDARVLDVYLGRRSVAQAR